ncbi:MAG: TAXI family TRAP transporter solute-binding subunit [Desulfobacter sp.]|nr:MAG: TAXI family TRAP transporter solute-binding subunit [Desulfobacter sp.]
MNYMNVIIKNYLPLILSLILGASVAGAESFDLQLGTSQSDNFSRFTGRVLERIFDRRGQGITLTAVPAPNDIHNLTNLQNGALDMALVDSRMFYDAMGKSGHFQFLDISYDSLRILSPLYKVPIALVVNKKSGITDLNGLRNKRLNAGTPLSTQHLCVETIMAAKNWSKKDFSLIAEISGSHSEDTMAFCHETVDAMVHIGVHPDSSLQQLLKLCNADLAHMADEDIRHMVESRPAFFKMEIAAGTYPQIPEKIITFGTQALLVTTQDLDAETAGKVLRILFENADRLASAHPSLNLVNQAKNGSLESHRGSVLYFPQ